MTACGSLGCTSQWILHWLHGSFMKTDRLQSRIQVTQLTSTWASGAQFLISVTTVLFLVVTLPLMILYSIPWIIAGLLMVSLYAILPAAFYGLIYAITLSDIFSENWRTVFRRSAMTGAITMFLHLAGCAGPGLYKRLNKRRVVHDRSPHLSRKGCVCHCSLIFCTELFTFFMQEGKGVHTRHCASHFRAR
jgi:glucan phosphoethanolaminetransferase (alkaline phosphatase superfamily)